MEETFSVVSTLSDELHVLVPLNDNVRAVIHSLVFELEVPVLIIDAIADALKVAIVVIKLF